MTSISLIAQGSRLEALVSGPLTAGMVGLPVSISCDASWEGLTKTLICKGGGTPKDITGVGSEARVAPEVMRSGFELYLGIEGRNADGSLVIPTVWACCGPILEGANPTSDPSTAPDNPVWAQLQSQIGTLEELETQEKTSLTAAVSELAAGKVPMTRTINGKALSEDIALTPADIGAISGDTAPLLPENGMALEDMPQGFFAYTLSSTLVPAIGIPEGFSSHGTLFGTRSSKCPVVLYQDTAGSLAVFSLVTSTWVPLQKQLLTDTDGVFTDTSGRYLNPLLVPGNIYHTTQWFLGSPVYRTTLNLGVLGTAGTVIRAKHGYTYGVITDCRAMVCKIGEGGMVIGHGGSAGSVAVEGDEVVFTCNSDLSEYMAFVEIAFV